MGPLAHIHFERLLISESYAYGNTQDQDHPVWFLVSGASTPDRTASLSGDKDAKDHLTFFSQRLERLGADFLVITCNTAHAYIDHIRKHTKIPVLSIVDCAVHEIAQISSIQKVGILATDGTLQTRLYQNALREKGVEALAPRVGSSIQKKVMDAIYDPGIGIKNTGSHVSNEAIQLLTEVSSWMAKRGVDVLLTACTELSVAFEDSQLKNLVSIDPLRILAKETIRVGYSDRVSTSNQSAPKQFINTA